MAFYIKLMTVIKIRFYICIALFIFSNSANAINPKVGVWWSPSESGIGFVFDGSGQTLAMQAYTYDSSGKPMWYLVVGQLTNNGVNWSGTLQKYISGQCFGCTYKPNQTNGNDGVISVQFTSDTTGILTMPNGMKSNIQSYFPIGTYPIGPISASGLAALYGTVSLNYKFNIDATIFSDSFKFSSSNLNASGTALVNYVIADSTRGASCVAAPSGTNYMYLCVISAGTGTAVDLFMINVNASKQISGLYQYCSSSTTTSACAAKLLSSPSGVVTGSVLTLSSGLEIFQSQNVAQNNKNQKDVIGREQDISTNPSNTKTSIDFNVLFDVVESFERLLN